MTNDFLYSKSQLESDLQLIRNASKQAGEIALSFWNSENQVWHKNGNSPVSEADFAVDKFLKEHLLMQRPEYGWLSEETEDNKERLNKSVLFVVDPIDGTRGFIAGKEQWCISIALVVSNRPVAGVLECPSLDETYFAFEDGGSFLNDAPLKLKEEAPLASITGSRKLNAELIASNAHKLQVLDFVPSLAYRLAMVANNKVDSAIARPGAKDWDLAAADLVVAEAGGKLTDLNNNKIEYNLEKTNAGSLVSAGPNRHKDVIELVKKHQILS